MNETKKTREILLNYKAPYKLVKDDDDQGWDIKSTEDKLLIPGKTALVKTGLYLELEPNCYADVRPRSGLSSKGILCHLGLVDSGYRGEIKVCLTNLTSLPHLVRDGDRIAQLVFGQEISIRPNKVDKINKATKRGSKGLGSSGR